MVVSFSSHDDNLKHSKHSEVAVMKYGRQRTRKGTSEREPGTCDDLDKRGRLVMAELIV